MTSTSETAGVRDRGDTMLMTTILVTFLMLGAFALISASQAWAARRDVQAVAQSAARAAVQVGPSEARDGIRLDPGLAAQRATTVASAAGYTATIHITGDQVTVTVTAPVAYRYAAPGFPTSMTATATATYQRGITTGT